jgi:hypothetical protein
LKRERQAPANHRLAHRAFATMPSIVVAGISVIRSSSSCISLALTIESGRHQPATRSDADQADALDR